MNRIQPELNQRCPSSTEQSAHAAGLDVKVQGEWQFVPVTIDALSGDLSELTIAPGGAWLDEHWAPRAISVNGELLVRGLIVHPGHSDLHLDGWHRAVHDDDDRSGPTTRRTRAHFPPATAGGERR